MVLALSLNSAKYLTCYGEVPFCKACSIHIKYEHIKYTHICGNTIISTKQAVVHSYYRILGSFDNE